LDQEAAAGLRVLLEVQADKMVAAAAAVAVDILFYYTILIYKGVLC
jgi:hypothetical protein